MHQVRHQVVRRFGTEQDAKLTVAVEVASHFTPPTDSVTCSWLQQQRARLIHQGMMAAPAESFFIRSPAHSLVRSVVISMDCQQPSSTASASVCKF